MYRLNFAQKSDKRHDWMCYAIGKNEMPFILLHNAEFTVLHWCKVTWPTLRETRATSVAVLAFVVAMALFLGVVDLGLSKLVSLLFSA